MIRHLRYWWLVLRNDFLDLCWFGASPDQITERVMAGLRRDKQLSDIFDEYEDAP
jgi:hypothetical protein